VFTLDQVVPWGRSFDEYRRMFALSGADLQSSILGCADGPASFNAEATRLGARVVSCDPLYRHEADEIGQRIDATFDEMIEQTRQNADEFVWDSIASVEDLARLRRAAMDRFLDDYETGKLQGRYVAAELPATRFADASFDLAVCSHFLFLYGGQLNADFHVAAVRDLVRVAREVRIFPLLALGAQPSPHVPVVMEAMRDDGCDATIETVAYEFVRGGNQMMRIRVLRATLR
jgi:hypothetical protein